MHTPVILSNLTEAEWLEERKLGSSDIASVLGVGYQEPVDLMLEKLGQKREYKWDERLALGKYLEPYIAERYYQRTSVRLQKGPSLCIHPTRDWQTATPDRLRDGFKWLAEFKAIFDYPNQDWGDEGSSDFPEKFIVQTTWQMGVCGSSRCDLAPLFVPHGFRLYHIEFDRELFELLTEAGHEFWKLVEKRELIDKDWTSSLSESLKSKFSTFRKLEKIELGAELDEIADQYLAFKSIESEAAENKKAAKAKLDKAIGDSGIGLLPSGRQIVKSKVERRAYSVDACHYFNLTVKSKRSKK